MDMRNIFINLSTDELITEEKLYKKLAEVQRKVDHALDNYSPSDRSMLDLGAINREIVDLKGYLNAPQGQRACRNSTELAEGLLNKIEDIEDIDSQHCIQYIDHCRNTQKNIKSIIEFMVIKSKKNGLDLKFTDIADAVNFWDIAKVKIFDKQGRYQKLAWDKHIAEYPHFYSSWNYIKNLIEQLSDLEREILEFNASRRTSNKIDAMKRYCQRVSASMDDNKVFLDIFTMGQLSVDLDRMKKDKELLTADFEAYKAKEDKHYKTKDWAWKLSINLYLDHWIKGDYPTANQAEKAYPYLVKKKADKTIMNEMVKQRKYFSSIDCRMGQVSIRKGRNKAI